LLMTHPERCWWSARSDDRTCTSAVDTWRGRGGPSVSDQVCTTRPRHVEEAVRLVNLQMGRAGRRPGGPLLSMARRGSGCEADPQRPAITRLQRRHRASVVHRMLGQSRIGITGLRTLGAASLDPPSVTCSCDHQRPRAARDHLEDRRTGRWGRIG
jgi:hypothetical protein